MTSIRRLLEAALGRLAQVGADPHDDVETRQRQALLVLISVLILPISLLWGALYLAFGSPVGYVPLVYFSVLLGAIAVFARTRNFAWLLRVALLDIVLAPTLSMIPLGGFLASGGVGLWGILAPMGALVFGGVRATGAAVSRQMARCRAAVRNLPQLSIRSIMSGSPARGSTMRADCGCRTRRQ